MSKALTRYQKIVFALKGCIDKEKKHDNSYCEKCHFSGGCCRAKLMKAAKEYIEGFGKMMAPEMGQGYSGDIYYCGECGTIIKRNDRYCRACGTEIDWFEGHSAYYEQFEDDSVVKPWDYEEDDEGDWNENEDN